jgi:hypothetical protein
LARASDGKSLFEHSYHYESGPGWFIDWTRNGALESVAQTGYDFIASQIAEDIFEPAAQPPILIGPGQKRSQASSVRSLAYSAGRLSVSLRVAHHERPDEAKRLAIESTRVRSRIGFVRHRAGAPGHGGPHMLTRPARRRALIQNASGLRFVSFVPGETNSLEIHTSKTEERLRSPQPPLEPRSNSGDMYDTEWAMDGLENDRNAVVQGIASLAAVPLGLWEQTVGLVRKHSRERLERFSKSLNAVTTQQRFEGALADEVANCLESKVAEPIRRTEEPMKFAFTKMVKIDGEESAPAVAAPPCATALEIQVLSTKLVGKHRNSSSRAMWVEVQVTVFRTSDGQEIYSRPIQYKSSEKRLKDWAASDARLFRQELEACSRRTAQALVSDLMARGFVTPLAKTNSAVLEQRN